MATGDTTSNPFLRENFNAPGYVNSFLEGVKPGEESKKLQSLRQSLNARNNQAAETIKDIVFEHYKHFIETSKEISNLEREIYQLSSLLSEQKGLIENLMEMSGQDKKSSCNGSVHSSTSTAHNQLHSLMAKMDGVATILNHLKENERVVLQNQMTLLNADNMQPEHPILVVLLTNSLLIGYPTPNSKCSFHLVSNQPLDNLAAINFKSHNSSNGQEGAEHILQLLIFPEQIYVKCENARVKREWLEGIEQTKRRQEQEKSLVRQATIRAKRKSILGNVAPQSKKTTQSLSEVDEEGDLEKESKKHMMSVEDTQWLNDLISELQDVISHRHMEQAVEMLLEWKSCNCQDAAINAKFEGLERSVVKMLSDEVRRPGALHGGTRALSKPLSLLTSLDRPIFAIDLYLKRRSTFLRSNARDLTISEEPLSYVKQISSLFINEILDVTKEFQDQRKHYCLILQWSSGELSMLLSMIRRHVIEVAPTMTVLAHTWRILMENCDLLVPVGLDLSFEVHRLLTPAMNKAMEHNYANIIEAICLRISEERWKPNNLENESNMNRFLEEMSDLGLSIDSSISKSQRYSLNIAQSACQFSRVALSLSKDFALISSPHLEKLTENFEKMLWCEYLFHLSTGPGNEVHQATCQFIVAQVIPLCDNIYHNDNLGSKGFVSQLLPEKFPALIKYSRTGSFDEEVANV